MKDKKYRLRPSVSMVPIIDGRKYDFFMSNIRKTISLVFDDHLLPDIISKLDGEKTVEDIITVNELDAATGKKLYHLITYLKSKCLIEDCSISSYVESQDLRRVIHFISDFVPTDEVLNEWKRFCDSKVMIIGLGGVGSWVASLLASSGVKNFMLVDNDQVSEDNLNRSLFNTSDIGKYKADAIFDNFSKISNNINAEIFRTAILSENDLQTVINETEKTPDLIINCADYPNVDETSKIISNICMERKMPFIISGGYNLHLSLIGPTIIPFESACVDCMRITLDELNDSDLNKGLRKLLRPRRNIGNFVPMAGISSSFAVSEAIRVLLRSKHIKPTMTNRRGEFNFNTFSVHYTELLRRNDCPKCGN